MSRCGEQMVCASLLGIRGSELPISKDSRSTPQAFPVVSTSNNQFNCVETPFCVYLLASSSDQNI